MDTILKFIVYDNDKNKQISFEKNWQYTDNKPNELEINYSFDYDMDMEVSIFCAINNKYYDENRLYFDLFDVSNEKREFLIKIDDTHDCILSFYLQLQYKDLRETSGIIKSILFNIDRIRKTGGFPDDEIFINPKNLDKEKAKLIDEHMIVYDIYENNDPYLCTHDYHFVYYSKERGDICLNNITKIDSHDIPIVKKLADIMINKDFDCEVYPGGDSFFYVKDPEFAKYCNINGKLKCDSSVNGTPAFMSMIYFLEGGSETIFNISTIDKMIEFYKYKTIT